MEFLHRGFKIMISYEKTTEDCLKEMFSRVGEAYPNPELTKHDDWFQKRTWTEDEKNDFRDWMKKLLKKRYHFSEKKLDWEIGLFLLDWGWKIT